MREALGIAFEGGDYEGRWAAVDAVIDEWPWADDVVPVAADDTVLLVRYVAYRGAAGDTAGVDAVLRATVA